MAEVGSSGLSVSEVTAMIAAQIAAQPTAFVASGAPMTIAQVLATYPAGAAYDGMYANVSNLYNGASTSAAGGVREVLRCRQDVTNGVYSWTPQREEYNASMSPTGGSVSLIPLVTPPTVRLAGTLLGNLTVTPSATNAFIGQQFTVIQNSTLGLFVTNITGLLGSNLTLLGNTVQRLEYASGGWMKASS